LGVRFLTQAWTPTRLRGRGPWRRRGLRRVPAAPEPRDLRGCDVPGPLLRDPDQGPRRERTVGRVAVAERRDCARWLRPEGRRDWQLPSAASSVNARRGSCH